MPLLQRCYAISEQQKQKDTQTNNITISPFGKSVVSLDTPLRIPWEDQKINIRQIDGWIERLPVPNTHTIVIKQHYFK